MESYVKMLQWDHPALKQKYRGYNAATGQVTHDYNWFDATAGRHQKFLRT